jgi:hypothetical protein
MMTDYEVLVNSPIGENCTIDGISARCIFDIDGGEYEESVPTLRVPVSQSITSASVVAVRGKTYGVISILDDPFGERKIILGDIL